MRTRVLEWSLSLEEEGITGEGLTFSDTEKQTAQALQVTYINHIYGDGIANLQQGSGKLQQTTAQVNEHDLTSLADELRRRLGALTLEDSQEEELAAALTTIEEQAAQPNPDSKILRTNLGRVKDILITGNAARELLEPVIAMLGSLV